MGTTSRRVSVILYHYDASPMARKVKNILAIKRIQYHTVNMPMTLPRPDLADRLGVTYRRIPVLAIGRDVYCDSTLIAYVLERRFPSSDGFGTLFPMHRGGGKTDTGMIKALAMSYADKTLAQLGSQALPYHKFTPEFLDDRNSWFGKKVDPQALLANQPAVKSWLASQLALIEEQLNDGREWLMDTESPSLADIAVHAQLEWMLEFRPLRNLKDLFDPAIVPTSVAWIGRLSAYIAQTRTNEGIILDDISGARAAKIITLSIAEDSTIVGFDETEAARLGVRLYDIVSITPTDDGKVPTTGRLLSLNKEEIAVETQGSAGIIHCHFPRLHYMVKRVADETKARM